MVGGDREEATVALYITVNNGEPPIPFPARDPTPTPKN